MKRGGPVIAPSVGARNPESGDLLIPEGVAVRLSLDEYDIASSSRLLQTPTPVEGRLVALPPTKTCGSLECRPPADSEFGTAFVTVGDPYGVAAEGP